MSALAVERDWIRDYAAFLHCGAGDEWLREAGSQVNAWLRSKGFDVDINVDGDYTSDGRILEIRTDRTGKVEDFSIRLIENGPQGVWTTQLLAHDEPGDNDWIHIEVRNSEGRFVNAPRLMRQLVDVLPLGDGRLEFSATAQVYRSDDVDRLVEALEDTERHALIFVAGTSADDDQPFDAFRRSVETWTHELVGLAQVVVLDPLATEAFSERVGTRFHAPAGTIRTYQPGVQLGSEINARQHRILGAARLSAQSAHRTRYLLGDIARRHAAARPLPAQVQAVRRRFERLENRRLVRAITEQQPQVLETEPQVIEEPAPRPTVITEVKDYLAQIGLVKQILKLEEITESGLRKIATTIGRATTHADALAKFEARVEELQNRTELLEDHNRELLELLSDQQMETQVALLDVDQREARIRWLESRLREHDDFDTYGDVPEEFLESRPASFEELLKRVAALPGVEFTGDADEAERLNAIDTNDAALRTAWDAVLAMVDYVKARSCGDCDASLDHYINATPSGYRTFPPGKWASTETAQTMKGWGDERMFAVPESVDPSGQVAMKAHFKLARIGMATPRMHIYDGHPHEPVVYIGYIGTHLTNTKTN